MKKVMIIGNEAIMRENMRRLLKKASELNNDIRRDYMEKKYQIVSEMMLNKLKSRPLKKASDSEYMMATRARYGVVDLSRTEPSICLIKEGRDENFVGMWPGDLNYDNILFPRETTRPLKDGEIEFFNGHIFSSNMHIIHVVETKSNRVPREKFRVLVHGGSIYYFGIAEADGSRFVRRTPVSLPFEYCRVFLLVQGRQMLLLPSDKKDKIYPSSPVNMIEIIG